MEESPLIAPSAADAAAENGNAAADTGKAGGKSSRDVAHTGGDAAGLQPGSGCECGTAKKYADSEEHGSEEHYGVGHEGCFIASFVFFTCGEAPKGTAMLKISATVKRSFTRDCHDDDLLKSVFYHLL